MTLVEVPLPVELVAEGVGVDALTVALTGEEVAVVVIAVVVRLDVTAVEVLVERRETRTEGGQEVVHRGRKGRGGGGGGEGRMWELGRGRS